MKRTAIYIRVSTTEQANEGYSIQGQKERLLAYCKAHDWIIADIYVDGGFSGSNTNRPALQKLIVDVKKFDVVLVYKLDRLSRSQRDTLYLIEEVFLPNGVDFVSMNESFDTSVPFGKAMIGMLSVFAQLEREQIKERMSLGKEERAKEGLWNGGANLPVGYDYIDGKLVINEYEAEQVRTVFKLYIEGLSCQAIIDRMKARGFKTRYGGWEVPSQITRTVSNEVYLGRIKYNAITTPNAHEAIVTREQFDEAAQIRAKRHEIYGDMAFQGKYLLSSMLFCGKCGARYSMRNLTPKNGKPKKWYACYSRSKAAKSMIKDPNCQNRHWPPDELEGIVDAEVRAMLFDPSRVKLLLAKQEKSAPKPSTALPKRIAEIDKQIGKLMKLYQNDNIPPDILGQQIGELHNEKMSLQASLPPEPKTFDFDLAQEIISDAAAVWDFADAGQKRRVLERLIKRIVLDEDEVKIEWFFQE